jgi:hypothetical protein
MEILLAVIAAILLVLCLASCGSGKSGGPPAPASGGAPTSGENPAPATPPSPGGPSETALPGEKAAPTQAEMLAREELLRLLRELAASPAPQDLAEGAMCYKVAGPPERVEYVCPRCGERTLYARSDSAGAGDRKGDWDMMECVARDIPACRRRVVQIRGIGVELDESAFCKKCRPDEKDPVLELVVKFAGQEQPHRVRGVSEGDLALLEEFLTGNPKHPVGAGREEALKKFGSRIRELLGLKE